MRVPGLLPLLLALQATPPPTTDSQPAMPAIAAPSATATLRGRVVGPDGQPVAEAHIEVFTVDQLGNASARAETVSGANGAFELAGRPAGPVVVLVNHPCCLSSDTLSAIDPTKGPTDVQIALRRGGRITGSVRRRDGRPIPESVLVSDAFYAAGKRPPVPVRADGTFVITGVTPGPSMLVATVGAGTGQHTMGRAVEAKDDETVVAELVLEEVIVSGRVTRSGAPGAGLRVTLQNRLVEPRHRINAVAFGRGQEPRRNEALTDENGAYSLIADPGAAFVSVATADGQTRFAVVDVEVPDEDAYLLDLTVGGTTSVSGLVTDRETGRPVKGARVAVGPSERATRGGRRTSTIADADGRFVLDAVPGEQSLWADDYAEGYEPQEMPLAVPEGGVSDLHIELAPAPRMTVRAVDPAGKPIADALVILGDARGRLLPRHRPTTDATGRARLLNLEPKPHSVYVLSHADRTRGFRASAVPADGDVVVTMQPVARLTVRTLEGGRPVPAKVTIQSIDGYAMVEWGEPWTDASGVAVLEVPPGTLEMVASTEHPGPRRGRGTAVLSPGGEGDLTIAMEALPPGPAPKP
jgi:hypothetical protein